MLKVQEAILRATARKITGWKAAETWASATANRNPFHWVASASRIIRKVTTYKQTSETADTFVLRPFCER